jgi:hypothetical protein
MHIRATSILLVLGATSAMGCGGSISARSPDTDGGIPESGALDSGGPDTAVDSPAPSCPASYTDVPQGGPGTGTSCPGTESCSYFNQFTCYCDEGSGWECSAANCICIPGNDGGCVNQGCTSDADCPSGQHCSAGLGSEVCSVGCEGDAACPVGAKCQQFVP